MKKELPAPVWAGFEIGNYLKAKPIKRWQLFFV